MTKSNRSNLENVLATRCLRKRAPHAGVTTGLFATIIVVFVNSGCALDLEVEDVEVGRNEEPLYIDTHHIWRSPVIPVCWENPQRWNETERGWVEDAIELNWESVSNVEFTGFGPCVRGMSGIRIGIDDVQPHTRGLGSRLDGAWNGMVLNFTFANWGHDCGVDATERERCIRLIAIHEFGHALGFSHEQNRTDTEWAHCDLPGDGPQGSNGTLHVGEWDLDSVMNYCNPSWNGNGNLSAGDIQGVQAFYGGPEEGEAWVFSECGYRGDRLEVSTDAPFLPPEWDDEISSVLLGPGASMNLYSNANFNATAPRTGRRDDPLSVRPSGRVARINRNERCLWNRTFNDRTSSYQVSAGPREGEVWLFVDRDFLGDFRSITANQYSMSTIAFNEMTGSVRVGPNTAVELFSIDGYRGQKMTLTEDMEWLGDAGFQYNTSSARIIDGPEQGEAWLFEHCDYRGARRTVSADTRWVGSSWNDRVSSVITGPGTRTTLYEHAYYRGRSRSLNDGSRCLDEAGFDNQLSSLRVAEGPGRGEAWLYDGCSYTGARRVVTADQSYLGSTWNDRVGSVLVGPDTVVDLFQHSRYRGNAVTLVGDSTCGSLNVLNEEASSLIITVVPEAELD